jgi:hypothetical protein
MPPRSEKPAKAQSTVTVSHHIVCPRLQNQHRLQFNPEDGHLTAVDHQLNRQYDAEILAAVLGYAMYDFVNWIAHFGNWNARELDLPHVDMIEKDYKNAGIDNISVLTAIFLVVDSSLIDTTALVQEQDLNEDVPLIKWSIEAVPETDAASGHHRITALLRYLKSLEDEITSFDTTIQALLAGNKAESTGTVKKIDRLQMRKAIVQGKLDKGGWWLVRVHDACEHV